MNSPIECKVNSVEAIANYTRTRTTGSFCGICPHRMKTPRKKTCRSGLTLGWKIYLLQPWRGNLASRRGKDRGAIALRALAKPIADDLECRNPFQLDPDLATIATISF